MSKVIIKIPILSPKSRIGEVVLSVFSVVIQSDSALSDAGDAGGIVWDYQYADDIHPFFLCALAIYKNESQKKIDEINLEGRLKHIFDEYEYAEPVAFSNDAIPADILMKYKNGRRVPICKFSRKYLKIDELQSEILSLFMQRIGPKIMGWMPYPPISYLLGELTCNIQEHSLASYGYLSVQDSNDDGDYLYLAIADNGIGIFGSYVNSQKQELIRMIGEDQAEALRYSTKGFSTKNLPNNESRGYGISTNLDMVVNGLKGTFLILSGNAFFRSDEDGEQFVNLPDNMYWDGTLILIRIPLKQKEDFNVYKYIE